MGWLRSVRAKFLHRPTRRDIIVARTDSDPALCQELIEQGPGEGEQGEISGVESSRELPARDYTEEDEAAVKIQAAFRGHLARRAFRALRSLVRLQALARGSYVRKQSQIALQCMHALVRLQVRVRARQLLSNFDG